MLRQLAANHPLASLTLKYLSVPVWKQQPSLLYLYTVSKPAYVRKIKPFQFIFNFKYSACQTYLQTKRNFSARQTRFRTLFGFTRPHTFVKNVRVEFAGLYNIRTNFKGLRYIVCKSKMVFPETLHAYFNQILLHHVFFLPHIPYWVVKKFFIHNVYYTNTLLKQKTPSSNWRRLTLVQPKWHSSLFLFLIRTVFFRVDPWLQKLRFLIFRHKVLNNTTAKKNFNNVWDQSLYRAQLTRVGGVVDWRCGTLITQQIPRVHSVEGQGNWESFSTYNWKLIV